MWSYEESVAVADENVTQRGKKGAGAPEGAPAWSLGD